MILFVFLKKKIIGHFCLLDERKYKRNKKEILP